MSHRISDEYLCLLKEFIYLCKDHPGYLHDPELKFFKDYLISMGANIPPMETEEAPFSSENKGSHESPGMGEQCSSDEESEESEVEIDESGIVEPDNDDPLPQGPDDPKEEVTESMREESFAKRSQAMLAFEEGNNEKAIKLMTESIMSNPCSAIGYAKRAGILLAMKKPNAAISDCNKALILNPDLALAFKNRGRAQRLLGNWVEAAEDLVLACRLDYSDEADEWLKEVLPNAKKIQEHRRKNERKILEKSQRKHKAQSKKPKDQPEKPGAQPEKSEVDEGKPQRMDVPKGEEPSEELFDIENVLGNSDLNELLHDPEVLFTLKNCSSDLGLNPKYKAAMSLIKEKMAKIEKEKENVEKERAKEEKMKKEGGKVEKKEE